MPENHIADETLEQYSLETLAVGDAERVEEHFLLCPLCQERLDQTDIYIRAMRAATSGMWSNGQRPRAALGLWLQPLFIATAALLTLVWLGGLRAGGRADAAPAAVFLTANREAGGPTLERAPSGRPLSLRLDATGLPPAGVYGVEVVTASGDGHLHKSARPSGGILIVGTPAFGAGMYWVRIYEDRTLLREFELEVQ
jgi:hypothetical protein